VIRTRSLTRHFADRTAVDDVSLDVDGGTFVALMGPNGAGKSTLLRLVAGLTRPSAGDVTVGGGSVRKDARTRRRIGVVGHESYLYGALSARENLELYARLFGLAGADRRVGDLLDRVGMSWAEHVPVEGFSRGMEQRLALARALLHDPDVLLFDEPFSGLDRTAERFLEAALADLRRAGKTALLVTHDPGRAVRSTDRAVVLRRGRVVLDRSLDPARDAGAEGFSGEYMAILEGATR
jgi:heme exporter protein A